MINMPLKSEIYFVCIELGFVCCVQCTMCAVTARMALMPANVLPFHVGLPNLAIQFMYISISLAHCNVRVKNIVQPRSKRKMFITITHLVFTTQRNSLLHYLMLAGLPFFCVLWCAVIFVLFLVCFFSLFFSLVWFILLYLHSFGLLA